MKLDKTTANLEALKSKGEISISDAISFFYNFSEDVEEYSGRELTDANTGDVLMLSKRLPWMSLLVNDIYNLIKEDMKPGKGKEKLEQLKEKLGEVQQALTEATKEYESLLPIGQQLEKEEKRLYEEREKCSSQKSKNGELEQNIGRLNSEIENMKLNIETFDLKRQSFETMYEQLKESHRSSKEKLEKVSDELVRMRAEYSVTEEEYATLMRNVDEINQANAEKRKTIEAQTLGLGNKRREYEDLKKTESEVAEECRNLESTIENLRNELEAKNYEAVKEKLENQKIELEMARRDYENAEATLNEMSQKKADWRKKIDAVNHSNVELNAEIEDILKEDGEIQKRNRELVAKRDELRSRLYSMHAEEYDDEKDALKSHIEQMRKALEALEKDRLVLEGLYTDKGLFIREADQLKDELKLVEDQLEIFTRDYRRVINAL